MLWLTFRQFRLQAVVAAVLLAGLTVLVVVVGAQALSDYHATVSSCARGTVASGSCSGAIDFVDKYEEMGQWLTGLLLVVPGLIGVFWGAPLVARELESGTFRMAWTQTVSRARWTLCKLGVLGLASMAVAGLCSLLVTWWSSPLDLATAAGPFAHFDSRDLAPIGYAAFAFALGVAAGALIRNTVAAMGATLVVFAGVRVAVVEWVRPHLMAPLVSRVPFTITTPRRIEVGGHLPQGSWIVSETIVNRAGQTVGAIQGILGQTAVGPSGVTIAGVGSCPNLRSPARFGDFQGVNALVAKCVNQMHLSYVTTYQPPNRYWPFQIEETLLFFALALAVGAVAVWWIRRLA